MSKTRLVSKLTAGLAMLASAGWFVTAAFPLAAAPQIVADGAGVTVELNGVQLRHRGRVGYPAEAAAKAVEGTVAVQVRLDAGGNVMDASVVSGPDELRRAVLESVLSWHFAQDAAGSTRTVTVSFQLPAQAPESAHGITPELRTEAAAEAKTLGSLAMAPKPSQIASIDVRGLSDQARTDLLAALPIHVGDTFSPETMFKAMTVARAFDEHLHLSAGTSPKGETFVTIALREASAVPLASGTVNVSQNIASPAAGAIQVGGPVQAAALIYGPRPQYPPLAKQAHISGVVHLHATIAANGTVQQLEVIQPAHPLLAPAAIEAVRTWRYKPTLMNGEPVAVETTIDVSFFLVDGQTQM